MPTDEEINVAVRDALSKRAAPATTDESGTLAKLVKGQLHVAVGPMPLDQVAGKLTDLFVEGRQNMPPNDYRPELRALVRSDFRNLGSPVPAHAVVEVLVNVAVGWMIDHSLPTPPGGRPIVMHSIDSLYLWSA